MVLDTIKATHDRRKQFKEKDCLIHGKFLLKITCGPATYIFKVHDKIIYTLYYVVVSRAITSTQLYDWLLGLQWHSGKSRHLSLTLYYENKYEL